MGTRNTWDTVRSRQDDTAAAEDAFLDAQTRSLTDPKEITQHLLLTAWRITKEIARARGLLNASAETLGSLPPKQWTITDKDRGVPAPAQSDVPADNTQYLAFNLPLLPAASTDWNYLVEFVCWYLEVPHHGPLRLAANLLVEEPALYWPKRAELVAYDLEFVEAVSRKLLKQTRHQVIRSLRRTYGLLQHEAMNLTSLAVRAFEYLSEEDHAAQRGLMIAKLEDFAHRMREAMHPREEMHALKTLAQVQGLTLPPKETLQEDLTDVIRRVHQESREPPPSPPTLGYAAPEDAP